MNMPEIWLRDHAILHGPEVGQPEGQFSLEYNVLHGLTDEQLRLRPQGWNSIAVLLWHITRFEDVAANVIIAGRPQLFDERNWMERLRLDRRDVGTGLADEEVEAVSRAIDLAGLRSYRAAVGHRTRQVIRDLPAAEWDRTVDAATVERTAAQGVFGVEAGWVGRIWEGKSKAWFVYWGVLGHSHMHLGQARWVKEMILGKRGR